MKWFQLPVSSVTYRDGFLHFHTTNHEGEELEVVFDNGFVEFVTIYSYRCVILRDLQEIESIMMEDYNSLPDNDQKPTEEVYFGHSVDPPDEVKQIKEYFKDKVVEHSSVINVFNELRKLKK